MDYRIVVQLEGGGSGASQDNPTVPQNSESSTEPEKEKATSTISVQSVISTARNPVGTALGAVVKAVPWVAAVMAVIGVASYITTTAVDLGTAYSGDYSSQMALSNLKTGIGHLMNPIGAAVSYARQQIETDKANKQIAEQRALMGNADINTWGKRGV